jgi:hypothetical protein
MDSNVQLQRNRSKSRTKARRLTNMSTLKMTDVSLSVFDASTDQWRHLGHAPEVILELSEKIYENSMLLSDSELEQTEFVAYRMRQVESQLFQASGHGPITHEVLWQTYPPGHEFNAFSQQNLTYMVATLMSKPRIERYRAKQAKKAREMSN